MVDELCDKVYALNKRFKLTNDSPCKLTFVCASDGYFVCLKVNEPFGCYIRPLLHFTRACDGVNHLNKEDVCKSLHDEIKDFSSLLIKNYFRSN